MCNPENGKKKRKLIYTIYFLSVILCLKTDFNASAKGIWELETIKQEVPGKSSSQRVDTIDIEFVKRYAPILNFHPKEGEFCCYPSCAEDAYPRAKSGKTGKNKFPKTLAENTPCYFEAFHTENGFRIKYWFWYNYNDYPTGPNFWGSHPGDWEYLEVFFEEGNPVKYRFSNHTGVRIRKPDEVTLTEKQVQVWVGKGSHANYESPDPSNIWSVFGFPDKVAGGGLNWNTAHNLIDIRNTAFCHDNYLGDWGDGKKIFGPLSRTDY